MLINVFILFLGVMVIVCSFFLSLCRLLNCLIVVENLNVLVLFVGLLSQTSGTYVLFIALLVIFTVEVILALVILTQSCDVSMLSDVVGW